MLKLKDVESMTCSECSDDEMLFLHARCHMKSKVLCTLDDDVLTVSCIQCGKKASDIAVTSTFLSTPGIQECKHHPGGLCDVLLFEGNVFVLCPVCNGPMDILAVKP